MTPRRVPELDGVRGIAIGMVVLYHYFLLPIQAPPGTFFSYVKAAGMFGFSGVDLFFVLSGFLIGGILLDSREATNYFRVFYTRRFFRIIPLYAVVAVASWTVSGLADGPLKSLAFWHENRLPWVTYPFFLQNVWMALRNNMGIWGLGVTWSLAVEEQFYLTLPLLIRVVSPRRLIFWVTGAIAAAPALRILCHTMWPVHQYSWVYLMPCRADALLLGVLGAMALRSPRWREQIEKHRGVLLGAMLVLLLGVVVLLKIPPDSRGRPYGSEMLTVGFTWLALLYLAIILYAQIARDGWISRCLRWRWLMWLGSIAYGMYLLHGFILAIISGLIWGKIPQGGPSLGEWGATILSLAITLGLCQVSWVYFEHPLIRLGHRHPYSFSPPNSLSLPNSFSPPR
jgi:peptidoglycan/LPS O-acetylase OafA/YrhL